MSMTLVGAACPIRVSGRQRSTSETSSDTKHGAFIQFFAAVPGSQGLAKSCDSRAIHTLSGKIDAPGCCVIELREFPDIPV